VLDGMPMLCGGVACGATPGDYVVVHNQYGGDRWTSAGSPLMAVIV